MNFKVAVNYKVYISAVRERIFQNEAKIASITKCALILSIKMLNGKKCLSKTFVSVQISFSNWFLQISEQKASFGPNFRNGSLSKSEAV